MSKSSKVEGGGTTVAVRSTHASAARSPVEEEESTVGHLELAHIWATLCLRKVAPRGAVIWTSLDAKNSSNPRCNKIQWIKTGKKRAWVVELLLCTSIKEWMKR